MGRGCNYTMRLNLTGFLGSRVITVDNDDGIAERGVFIPIGFNDLYEDPNTHHVLFDAYVNPTMRLTSNKTHNIRLKICREHLDKLKSLGFTNPYLGGMWINNSTMNYKKTAEGLSRVKFNND